MQLQLPLDGQALEPFLGDPPLRTGIPTFKINLTSKKQRSAHFSHSTDADAVDGAREPAASAIARSAAAVIKIMMFTHTYEYINM